MEKDLKENWEKELIKLKTGDWTFENGIPTEVIPFIHRQIQQAEKRGYYRGYQDGEVNIYDKKCDAIIEIRQQAKKELIEDLEKWAEKNKKEFEREENKYPDARWQKENFGSKQYNQALKDLLSKLQSLKEN